ncbi:MAG: hypothetical protein MPN21_25180 [Thermoanaerobaculia bacterium]|nr:hypothetical protein [Thermoanaerobaculia bacterium]
MQSAQGFDIAIEYQNAWALARRRSVFRRGPIERPRELHLAMALNRIGERVDYWPLDPPKLDSWRVAVEPCHSRTLHPD